MKQIEEVDGVKIAKAYKCDENGKIYSYDCESDKYVEMNTTYNNIGYEQVSLRVNKNKDRKTFLVHRVIANVFIEKLGKNSKLVVNHKDSNIKNNKKSNLEVITKSDNMKHMHEKGRHQILK